MTTLEFDDMELAIIRDLIRIEYEKGSEDQLLMDILGDLLDKIPDKEK